ncbi:hypothetical protein GCM10022280_04160 [Sphingomonas swuensis]|uniref:Glycosyltransferase RgtA/B/C/D-like domain-containing protein n=1 Tax=Sphingomonas swuensis TaxID=977800 RepID=A0ABP7SDM6_9SPHN
MPQPSETLSAPAALAPRSGWSVSAEREHRLLGLLATALSALILYLFYNRSWWAPDDGAYAYVAWRLLEGDVLGRDVADVHPGYINFINAAAMRLWGVDMLSMRIPLAALTVVQSALTYWLLRGRGPVVATVGAIAASALTFVLFVNPTANWYALFLAVGTIALLSWPRLKLASMAPWLGFLLGNAFLFRQLSAVFLAMGVLCWLILKHRPAGVADRRVARAVLILIGLGLGAYLVSKGSMTGLLLFGIWPFFLLARAWSASGVLAAASDEPFTSRSMLAMIAGGCAAFVPLAIYHGITGTVGSWLHDSLVAPFLLTSLDFFDGASFGALFVRIAQLSPSAGMLGWLNLAYWLTLLLAPVVLGLRALRTARSSDGDALTPLAVVAIFFGLVSIHYEIPIYLNYTSFLTLAGILSLDLPWRERSLWAGGVAALCGIALLFQAGQPVARGLDATLTGRTLALDASAAHPLASIRTTADDREAMAKILVRIDQRSAGDQRVLAAPFNPEFYFLAQRRSPFRHGITALELQDEAALRRSLGQLRRAPPALLIHRRQDKYNTPEVLALVAELKRWSGRREAVGDYDIYYDLDPRRPERGGQ